MTNTLQTLRDQLDTIDREIVKLLAERFKVIHQVGLHKKQSGEPILDPDRWARVLTSKKLIARQLGVDPQLIEDLYNRIHQHALQIEEDLQ